MLIVRGVGVGVEVVQAQTIGFLPRQGPNLIYLCFRPLPSSIPILSNTQFDCDTYTLTESAAIMICLSSTAWKFHGLRQLASVDCGDNNHRNTWRSTPRRAAGLLCELTPTVYFTAMSCGN